MVEPAPTCSDMNSLELSLFLCEHSNAEVSVLVRLKGGWDDQILSRGQREAAAHFSQVDEGFRASSGGMMQEEVLVQVDVPLTAELTDTRGKNQTECDTGISVKCAAAG